MGEDTYITDWRQVRDLRAGMQQRGNVETGEARGKGETLPLGGKYGVWVSRGMSIGVASR